MITNMRTLVLLSGGIDSTVLAYHLKAQGNEMHALSIDYGQRHVREIQCAAYVASQVCESHHRASVSPLFAPSALTGGSEDVVVPGRNLVFLSLAYAYAMSIQAEAVAIGVVGNDAERFPDCRLEFMGNFYETVGDALGNENVPVLRTPFIGRQKWELVRLGDEYGVEWSKTWSCYGGDVEPCGKCLACEERRKAFLDARGNWVG